MEWGTEQILLHFFLKAALWEEKPLAESFDFAHYCAIHRFLFEDLYEWAGKPRTVDISK